MAKIKSKEIDRLFEGFLSLENIEECYGFFQDLCTIKELKDMAQRLEAAELLRAGENYQTINKKLGISTATIGRISKCIKYGDGGYNIVLDRIKDK